MELKWNEQGLIPAVTVDCESGKVLMLAYMNRESYELTVQTGEVHYYSRSRAKLWKKGETSGHVQKMVSITADCDFDTLLIQVEQTGPACHTGSPTCFFNVLEDRGSTNPAILFDEEKNIADRKRNPVEGSYTNYLLGCGVDKICKKVGEEASEVIIAAKNREKLDLIGEVCDLFYHVQVLLCEQDIELSEVFDELCARRKKENNLKKKNTKGDL